MSIQLFFVAKANKYGYLNVYYVSCNDKKGSSCYSSVKSG